MNLKKILKLNKKSKKINYCKCRPITKEAEKIQLLKLKQWGYCPICHKYNEK